MKYISITFDDGREDNYLYAYPIMKKYGLVGTVFCTTGFIDGSWKKPEDWRSAGKAIEIEQLKKMQSEGWEIALHGDKHTTESGDLKVAINKFEEWGFKKPVGFSMPNSTIENWKLQNVIYNHLNKDIMYIRKGRKINTKKLSSKILFGLAQYTSKQFTYDLFNETNLNSIKNIDNKSIYSVVVRNEDDPKKLIKFIDQMPDNTWCVLMFHSIWPQKHKLHGSDPWNWSLEKFRYFCAGLKAYKNQNKVKVLTMDNIVKTHCHINSKVGRKKNNMFAVENKVVVWSIDDFNTLGLMRELGQFNLDMVFLIKGKAGFASRSKYCKEYVETDSIQDGIEYINEISKHCDQKPIVIISSDEIVSYVDVNRELIADCCILPVTSSQGDVQKYIDKNTMTALAQKLGILCPKSRYVKWNSAIDDVEYPCLIKPSHQTEGHYNEFKFKICKSKKELRKTLKMVRHESEFILQQYIPKEVDLLIYGARMRDGKTVFAGAMLRDRWADSGSSSHGFLTSQIPEGADVEKVREFVEMIDYYGPFSCEYGLVGNKAYFFEINLRNDGTSHYFFQAGANIPLAYVYSCAGKDYSVINTTIKEKQFFIDEVFDIENVIKGNISKKKWKADLEQATVYKYYDPNDKEPWKIVKKNRVKQIVQDIVLKKYRLYIVAILDKIGFKK